jgi:hypothetical protein
MKILLTQIFICTAIIFSSSTILVSQSKVQILQEKIFGSNQKRDMRKLRKDVKQNAKNYEKDGYKVAPGKLSIERQLTNTYQYQYEINDDGMPKYVTGEAQATAGTKIAAKLQAMEFAKLELVGKIETSVNALIENSVANEQIDLTTAETVTKTMAASKNIISKKIGQVIPLFEVYRNIGTKSIEASVIIAYDLNKIMLETQKEIQNQLKDELKDTHSKLDNILGLSSN